MPGKPDPSRRTLVLQAVLAGVVAAVLGVAALVFLGWLFLA